MKNLLEDISQCTLCKDHFAHPPRPVIQAHKESKIAVIGQAPGRRVHESGIPWEDPSGDRLRSWLGVDKHLFYRPELFALVPMGFCYPGKGGSGDLPPRPECAPKWHDAVLGGISDLRITLLIGQYAQKYYLQHKAKRTLTLTVKNYREYLSEFIPLPHPSPRNIAWRMRNPWFDTEILPVLRAEVNKIL